jgi:Putative MetA-pathway of phenol degradation
MKRLFAGTLALLLCATTAHASPCGPTATKPAEKIDALGLAAKHDDEDAAPIMTERVGDAMPIRLAMGDAADFGGAQEACPRTSLSLESRASVLVASKDFYGRLYANASLRGTFALTDRVWLSVWAPGLEYRFVANATIEQARTSLGAAAVGGHWSVRQWARSALALSVRALAPTETVFRNATRFGVEPGLALTHVWNPRFELNGNLAFPTLFTVQSYGSLLSSMAPSVSADLTYRPGRAFGVAGGGNLRMLDAFDLRAQVRFYPFNGQGSRLVIALGAAVPVHGRDRTDVVTGLTLAWDGM